jgi:CBS domain-containing protein
MRKMSDIVRNQDPVTLPPSATVREACQCMRERRVGAVLVTEDDRRLVGIFTGRDSVHRVLAEGKSAAHVIRRIIYFTAAITAVFWRSIPLVLFAAPR